MTITKEHCPGGAPFFMHNVKIQGLDNLSSVWYDEYDKCP